VEGERNIVMQSVKEALSDLRERATLPDYDSAMLVSSGHEMGGKDRWQEFSDNFSVVNGRPMAGLEELAPFLKDEGHEVGYCDPILKEKVGKILEGDGIKVNYEFERAKIDEYAFGITRASGIIAESGTVILNDEDTVDRLAALAPWVHVAVIGNEPIFETIPEAIENLGAS